MIRKIIDKGNRIRNVFKIFSFMDIVGDHVKTSLSKKEIEALARVFHDFSSERLKTVDVNGFGDRRQAEGFELWVYVVPKEERERIKGMVEQVLEGKSISSLSEEEN